MYTCIFYTYIIYVKVDVKFDFVFTKWNFFEVHLHYCMYQ